MINDFKMFFSMWKTKGAFWKCHFPIFKKTKDEYLYPKGQTSLVIIGTFKDQDNEVLIELCVNIMWLFRIS